MRRLHLQIYATVVGVLALFALLGTLAWVAVGPSHHEAHLVEGVAQLAGELLPAPGAPPEELRASLARVAAAVLADVSLYDAEGALLAAVGEPIATAEGRGRDRPIARERGNFTFRLRLPDGRLLLLRHPYERGPLNDLLIGLAALTAAVALGTYPLVRRLTRRLERLQARVDALGAGDLSARVEVEGRDEVAQLAESFNAAAERIERLVDAQRSMLAGASHELRAPLARIRMAAELLAGKPDEPRSPAAPGASADSGVGLLARPELHAAIERDVAELDAGIGELLLASRLDAPEAFERRESVDLLALVAEEAARTDARVTGESVSIEGDPHLLRRLVRNLLENARRHGGGAAVEASVARLAPGCARLRVDDRGPGVPEAERERVFEPFYRREGARGEGSGGGVGLGLALVRRIARHHGGEVRCLERPGGGTRIEVELGVHPVQAVIR